MADGFGSFLQGKKYFLINSSHKLTRKAGAFSFWKNRMVVISILVIEIYEP
jgi:hypothetical protein